MSPTSSFSPLPRLLRFIVATLFVLLCGLQAAVAAVNANTASVDELQTVRGIGPTIAQRIVQERAKGPYKSLDDLQARVKGVGSNSIRKMAEGGLTVSGGNSRNSKASGKAAGDAGTAAGKAAAGTAPATPTTPTTPTAPAASAPAAAKTPASPARTGSASSSAPAAATPSAPTSPPSARTDAGGKPAASNAADKPTDRPTDKPTDTPRKP